MNSMTGYGSAEYARDGVCVGIQITSVNRKNAEMRFHLPREMAFLEPVLRSRLRDRVTRGYFTINASIELSGGQGRKLVVDHSLVRALQDEVGILSDAGVQGALTISDLLRVPDLVRVEAAGAPEETLKALACESMDAALGRLNGMRQTEGVALKVDLATRSDALAGFLETMKPLASEAVGLYRDRLSARIQELLGDDTLDEERLGREVAVYADRSDVSEEFTRIASHLEQFRGLLNSSEPVGRRLEFIAQELGREINTTGSKTIHAEISRLVVEFKSELDRIREQVLNVE